MPKQLLEVGPGWMPALWGPGTIVSDPDVTYTAVDAQGMIRGEDTFYHRSKLLGSKRLPGVVALLHNLPFKDNVFDIVIMRSVLGEYTIPLFKAAEDEQPVGLFSGCKFYDTFVDGMEEVYRVLGGAGSLVISEEDTPLPARRVSERLEEIGFCDIEVTPYNKQLFSDTIPEDNYEYEYPRGKFVKPDPAWMEKRSQLWETSIVSSPFFGERNTVEFSSAPEYPAASYILTAKKPS